MVRRHVLGMPDDASVWARFGQRLGRAALWAARLLVDFRATRAGIRHAILAARRRCPSWKSARPSARTWT